ncbi:MAG: RagB/SusD family nutrient uptake outer membrane protein [Marinifilum sp.]|jgi:hypothetical protein|nr:RagB/SusD family nutrient uptake outer membrane protein [Marinifilum sp.]
MKKIYNLSLGLLMCFSIVGCDLWSDVEDAQPYFKQTEEASYSTKKGIDANLNGIYGATRGFNVGYHSEYSGKMAGLYNDRSANETNQTNVLLTIEDRRTAGIYLNWYVLITRANYMIKNLSVLKEGQVDGLTETRRKEIIGEAKIARALGHFQLLKTFGQHYDTGSEYGIPVVLEIIVGNEGPARNSVAEVYDAIYKDLDDGMTEAPDGIDRQRFTQWTAKAYKAKVALFKEDFATAASLAKDVIDNSGFDRESNYADIYANGFESKEIIFAPYSINYTEFISSPSADVNTPSDLIKSIADAQVDVNEDKDGDGDIDEKDKAFVNHDTGEGYDPRYAISHAQDLIGFKSNGKYVRSGYNKPGNTHYYLRLAEMHFIYAEAKARIAAGDKGDADFDAAVSEINILRARVSLPDLDPINKAELLEAIRIEKIMEFHLEWGQPWMDMVRYHFLGNIDIKTIRPVVKEDWQLIYPFNASTLNGNTNLKQNPGYIGNESN